MKNVYMVGIKGVGMTSLSLVYHRMGYQVSGSDVDKTFITDEVLNKYGITVYKNFNVSNLPDKIDFAVVSGAHARDNNPEYQELIHRKIPLSTHAEALGSLMDTFSLQISVCGSHGKTTVSSMIASIMFESNKKGAHCIGVPGFSQLDGGAYNGNDYFVAEADEYMNKPHIDNTPRFTFQHPDILVCTNIDYDHPDVYDSIESVQNAFRSFMEKAVAHNGTVIYCADDHNTIPVIHALDSNKIFSYGMVKTADVVISDVRFSPMQSTFCITYQGNNMGEYSLPLTGMHNVYNAAAAILACYKAGIDDEVGRKSLSLFSGSQRRFQLIYQVKNQYLFDDYAHHPREIDATIDAARASFPQHRIVVIFQPHTFSRTKALKEAFTTSLKKADVAYVLSTFSSEREKDIESDDLQILDKTYSKDELLPILTSSLARDDIIITMGAGDVYEVHEMIINIMNSLQ